MPELPEVETVRRGLAPSLEGARIVSVETSRPDLRFPFPEGFGQRLVGRTVKAMDRRGKFMRAHLSSAETLVLHLGMSGRFSVLPVEGKVLAQAPRSGSLNEVFHFAGSTDPKHDHVKLTVEGPVGAAMIVYNDPRRFGYMDLVPTSEIEECAHFRSMGPEPLSPAFNAASFTEHLRGRTTSIKAALLDQRFVAGVGNIYACEALFRAGISPRRKAGSVAGKRASRLVPAVKEVLTEAIEAGGSSLQDFAGSDGALGYFQHRFTVYDREGDACYTCQKPVQRLVQNGRSTFFCASCQR
ncbi:MAG: bifunctional DNA-formamidopyrimidine glycosylase/DNA-(apurinic or apyrimidinic site) lyase [Pseudomonadota bacterium]